MYNYNLEVSNSGRVKYIMEQKSGPVGSDTTASSAAWILNEGRPYKSDRYDGYPIGVEVKGNKYFFAGKWNEPKKRTTRKKV